MWMKFSCLKVRKEMTDDYEFCYICWTPLLFYDIRPIIGTIFL